MSIDFARFVCDKYNAICAYEYLRTRMTRKRATDLRNDTNQIYSYLHTSLPGLRFKQLIQLTFKRSIQYSGIEIFISAVICLHLTILLFNFITTIHR